MNASCPSSCHLRPEHVELRQREAFAVDVAADGDAARAKPLVGILAACRPPRRGTGAESTPSPTKRSGCCLDHAASVSLCLLQIALRKALVLDFPPPEIVDADGLDVDADLVHHRDAVVESGTGRAIFFVWRALDDIAKRHVPMAVDVDDLDALAGDAHLPARSRRLRAQAHAQPRYRPTVAPATVLKNCRRFGTASSFQGLDYRLICLQRDAGLALLQDA